MPDIAIKSLNISPLNRQAFAISWEFEPTIAKFSDYVFSLEKSEVPHDGYEFLSDIDPQSKYFVDSDVKIFKLWKSYYLRMKIENKTNSKNVYYSEFATVEHPPNLEALELIRRTKISLENIRYGNGVPCNIYLRKEGGQRCVECFDAIKKRSSKANCVNCYGTSYDGGFYSPIVSYVNFSVDSKAMGIMDHGNIIKAGNRAQSGNYPIIKPGDVVIDVRLNRVWSVSDVTNIERRRHIIKQILTLDEEDRTSVLFELLNKGK